MPGLSTLPVPLDERQTLSPGDLVKQKSGPGHITKNNNENSTSNPNRSQRNPGSTYLRPQPTTLMPYLYSLTFWTLYFVFILVIAWWCFKPTV